MAKGPNWVMTTYSTNLRNLNIGIPHEALCIILRKFGKHCLQDYFARAIPNTYVTCFQIMAINCCDILKGKEMCGLQRTTSFTRPYIRFSNILVGYKAVRYRKGQRTLDTLNAQTFLRKLIYVGIFDEHIRMIGSL